MRKPYSRPAVVYRARIEARAAACTQPNGKAAAPCVPGQLTS